MHLDRWSIASEVKEDYEEHTAENVQEAIGPPLSADRQRRRPQGPASSRTATGMATGFPTLERGLVQIVDNSEEIPCEPCL